MSALLVDLYAAAEDPSRWNAFLMSVSDLTRSHGAAVLRHDFRKNESSGAWARYDPAQMDLYFARYASINPWMGIAKTSISRGPVVPGEAILTLNELRATEFYTDWGKRNDVTHSLCTEIRFDSDKLLYLCLQRGERRGAYQESEASVLRLLVPHLHRGMTIHERLNGAKEIQAGFKTSAPPILLLTAEARLIEMSDRAQALIASGTVLGLQNGYLRALHMQSRRHFSECIARVSRTQVSQPAMISLRTTDAKEMIGVVKPLRPNRDPFSGRRASVMLTVVNPHDSHEAATRALGEHLGLTKAEIRLVVALLELGALDRVMEKLSVTRNTAKAQLAAIFRKTGTSRQAKLVRLFSSASLAHMGDES
ncbi:MAG: helix-turn-helix transcriptional regulator [Bryobacteraceae bacterium]